jgi:hypothetical protein
VASAVVAVGVVKTSDLRRLRALESVEWSFAGTDRTLIERSALPTRAEMNETDDNSLFSNDAQKAMAFAKRHQPRRLFLCLMLVCLLAGCGGLFTLLIRHAIEGARCANCENNLKQLGLALELYHDARRSLPPAVFFDQQGKPMHSWQSAALMHIYYNLTDKYNWKEPWDGPNNRQWLKFPLDEFACPSAAHPSGPFLDYVAVVGPDTLWPGRDRVRLPPNGKGSRDTILLIEMPDSQYRCLEPRCPTVEEFIAKIKSPTGTGVRTNHAKGLPYITVGGQVRWFAPGGEKGDKSNYFNYLTTIRVSAASPAVERPTQSEKRVRTIFPPTVN